MKLILMRHAKSDWAEPEPDHARPLNARGQRSATAMGDWLRRTGHLPGEALVSDARRTVETFDRLALDLAPRLAPSLYEASPEAMLSVLRTATADTVLMIGHNPGIGEFAARLVAVPPAHKDFGRYPTAATTILTFDTAWSDTDWGGGTAGDFAIPRELT